MGLSCSIVLYLLYPYQLRFANCALPTPSPQEKAFCISFFAQEMKSVVYFCINNKHFSPSWLSDAFDRAFLREEGGTRSVTEGACVTFKKAFSCGEGGIRLG